MKARVIKRTDRVKIKEKSFGSEPDSNLYTTLVVHHKPTHYELLLTAINCATAHSAHKSEVACIYCWNYPCNPERCIAEHILADSRPYYIKQQFSNRLNNL